LERDAFLKSAWIRRAARSGLTLAVVAGLAAAVPAPAQDLETAVQESYPTNLVLLRDATRAAVARLFVDFSAPAGDTLLVEPDGANEANWYVENQLLAYLTQGGYRAYLKEASPRPGAGGDQAAGTRGPTGQAAQAATDAGAASPSPQGTSPSLADAVGASADTGSATGEAEPAAREPAAPPSERAAPASVPEAQPPEFVLRYRVLHFEISYPKNYRTSPLGSRRVQRRVSVSLVASLLQGARENVVWVGDGSSERLDTVPAGKLALLEGSDFPFTQPTLQTRGLGKLVEPALVSGIVLGLIYLFYTNQD
jgi:hypothetical protein